MANHLAAESSPYLLQHKDNPVDWYPWSPEATRRAREEDRPIFLSIGYSACHWCHVMERESFTDAETAAYLNEHFVCIKVDREERPDLDDVYMKAVTALTGSGGWPLSAWLTPEGVPFYGGTYFPPSPRYGRPSFKQVLSAIADMWLNRRDDILAAATKMHEHLLRETSFAAAGSSHAELLASALTELLGEADPVNGGWGTAPKFPAPMSLEFLLAAQTVEPSAEAEQVIRLALDSMANGGIYDHLGGGFHRYSVDEVWLVPHFEKMLYDNAQLARCYLHAWQLLREPRYRIVAEETLQYLLRDMQHAHGGFFSAEDADSDGEEGKFYTWTRPQIDAALPSDSALVAAQFYGVTEQGNFEGTNILHRSDPAGTPLSDEARTALLAARELRTRPGRDDKVLAGWNGLALAALAEAGREPGGERFAEAAMRSGRFILTELVADRHRLHHSWKNGKAQGMGFLEDYACVIEGLLALYATTFAEEWFDAARRFAESMLQHFARPNGGFFDTSDEHETLIVRPRSLQDSPTPSGNAMAATVLLRLAAYTGDVRYADAADGALEAASGLVARVPIMCGQWLWAMLLAEKGATEVAIVGDPATAAAEDLLQVLRSSFRPHTIAAVRPPGSSSLVPLLEGKQLAPEEPAAAWVCRRSTCSAPTSHPKALAALLDDR